MFVCYAKTSCIAFGVQCPTALVYRNAQKYLNVLQPVEGNMFVSDGRRNYLVCLKVGTNVHVLCEINSIVFGVHCPICMSTGIHKSFSIHNGLW